MRWAVPLGVSESANCYIVTKPGVYRMPAVKGNDKSQKVSAASVEVLWETRSDANVRVGDIVNLTGYDNDNIYFNVKGKTSSTVPEGNALIAAKDASGEILWSWHIWVTSVMPEDQVYKNGAGTMMECDLGAACVESDAYPWSSGLLAVCIINTGGKTLSGEIEAVPLTNGRQLRKTQ